jgi:adenosylhomocysteine nucleosidase
MKRIFLPLILAFLLLGCSHAEERIEKVVLISANAEWRVVQNVFPNETIFHSLWGEYFFKELPVGNSTEKVIFFHGGWGKVAAAASTQYCIDQWNPKYIINLGTCGGFEGEIRKYDIILVDRTVIYDIAEAMGDSQEAIDEYSTTIDLSWIGGDFPTAVTKTLLVSADKDLVPSEIPMLKSTYHAVAGDWETGAIAYTCAKNNQRVLILRGVSDLVSLEKGGEAYQKRSVFIDGTEVVMKKLLADLPRWLERCPASPRPSPEERGISPQPATE